MFLAKYWKYIASILLILMVFGYWKSLTMKIASQEKTIIQLKVDEQLCQNANSEWKRITDEAKAKQDEVDRKKAIDDAKSKALNDSKIKQALEKAKNAEQALHDANLNSKPCDQAVEELHRLLGDKAKCEN